MAEDRGTLDTASGLGRIYATSWLRTATWALETSLRAGARVMRAAVNGESPVEFLQEAGGEIRDEALRMFGLADKGEPRAAAARGRGPERDSPSTLRERGAELLRRSADVRDEEATHPAYERILGDLAPDEARILRLLAAEGAQPSIDIRSGLPMVSQLVAPGRTMIGAEAGCRHLDRLPSYLNNLSRLGLIWFSREPVSDHLRYQVLEAQPDVLEAMRKGGRTARTVRRSILLTPFGKDFCDVCLPIETAEIEALEENGTAAAPADLPVDSPPDLPVNSPADA
jgi:hypothetical protein